MSNRPVQDPYATEGGYFSVGADRYSLFVVLFAGKALDAASTVTVLSLRENVYESMWFTRTLMERFGLFTGSLFALVVAVVGVMVLAESGAVVARLVPDGWTPDDYPAAFRVVTYCSAGVWYGFLGVHNFSLLF